MWSPGKCYQDETEPSNVRPTLTQKSYAGGRDTGSKQRSPGKSDCRHGSGPTESRIRLTNCHSRSMKAVDPGAKEAHPPLEVHADNFFLRVSRDQSIGKSRTWVVDG